MCYLITQNNLFYQHHFSGYFTHKDVSRSLADLMKIWHTSTERLLKKCWNVS
jgi:hypothetical protein